MILNASHNVGFHALDTDAPNPHGPPGPIQLGRNLKWSESIADLIVLHCHNAPPEVAVDALGMAAMTLASTLAAEEHCEPLQAQMQEVLANVAARIFHHDALHALLGISSLCSATVGKYVENKYPPRDRARMH